jgi:ketosteroid isomerase-like protein
MGDDIALRLAEAINQRDYGAIEELCAPDVQLRLPPGQVFFGRDEVGRFLHRLEELIPDLTFTPRKVWRGMNFVIVEWDTAGHPADRRRAAAEDSMGVVVMELGAGGDVERVQLYLDTARWRELTAQGPATAP